MTIVSPPIITTLTHAHFKYSKFIFIFFLHINNIMMSFLFDPINNRLTGSKAFGYYICVPYHFLDDRLLV